MTIQLANQGRAERLSELRALLLRATELVAELGMNTVTEEGPTGPLTPAQLSKRNQRDKDKQARMREIQSSANSKIAGIRSKLGR